MHVFNLLELKDIVQIQIPNNLINIGKLILLAFFLCWSGYAQQLQLNQPLESEIRIEEKQTFTVKANAGDFVRVVLWQKSVDVSVQAIAQNGNKIIETDNSDSPEEPERISLIASETGEIKFEVNGLKVWKEFGKYQINLEVLRPNIPKDKSQIEAETVYNQAVEVWFSKQTDAKTVAFKRFSESIPLFQTSQDVFGEAFVYFNLGTLYLQLNDLPKSIESSAKAAQMFKQINAGRQTARALSNQAAVNFKLENLAEAMKLSQTALEIYRQINYPEGIAEISGNLGAIASNTGQPRVAIKHFEEILPIFQTAKNRNREAWTLHNLGSVYDDLGEPLKAIDYFQKALKIRQEIGEKQGQAVTMANLALVLKGLGEQRQAIELLKKSREIFAELGNEVNQAFCFNNLGTIYDDLGDYLQAIENYEKALNLNRKFKLRANEARNLNNLALISLKLNEINKAIEFQTQSLTIFQESKDKVGEAKAVLNLGVMFLRQGNTAKSMEFYQTALPIFRQAELRDWEANALFRIGEAQFIGGETEKALENCSQSLEISQQIQNRSNETISLLCVARAENKLGRFAESQTKIEKALELIEDSRTKIGRQDLQSTYFSGKQDFYEFYLELLLKRHQIEPNKGFDALALQTAERARARNLLESIGATEIREGISPQLLAKEKELQQKINKQENLRQQLILSKAGKPKIDEIENGINENLRELRDVTATIRQSNPKFAGFSQAKPLSLTEIQKQVLDSDSVLLEFVLGKERSYLFVVSQTSLKVVELPKREEIEVVARDFYAALKARAQKVPNEADAIRQNRLQKSELERQKKSLELSRILLEPIAKEIENKRLLVVAAEILHYIPFAVLASPKNPQQFLIETNEIVNLPSASALATLRKSEKKTANKELAIFADPIFSGEDTRIRPASAFRSSFQRLDFSREEAEKIASFSLADKRLVALDFQANLQNLRSQDLRQFRYLHFATHGTLDSRFPELSGIVLSLVDEKGNPQEGFLRLNEIYNLRLNAKMVVLSACETGLGSYIKGEGLVGFTHALMYAGAESVVASLWRVDDYATSELMQRFYQSLLKEGLPPSKALQKAQISMIKEKGLNNPFYWSAFTLQGEWR